MTNCCPAWVRTTFNHMTAGNNELSPRAVTERVGFSTFAGGTVDGPS